MTVSGEQTPAGLYADTGSFSAVLNHFGWMKTLSGGVGGGGLGSRVVLPPAAEEGAAAREPAALLRPWAPTWPSFRREPVPWRGRPACGQRAPQWGRSCWRRFPAEELGGEPGQQDEARPCSPSAVPGRRGTSTGRRLPRGGGARSTPAPSAPELQTPPPSSAITSDPKPHPIPTPPQTWIPHPHPTSPKSSLNPNHHLRPTQPPQDRPSHSFRRASLSPHRLRSRPTTSLQPPARPGTLFAA